MGDKVSDSIAQNPVALTAQGAQYPRISMSGMLDNSFYGDPESGGQNFKLRYHVPMQSSPEGPTPNRAHTNAFPEDGTELEDPRDFNIQVNTACTM